MIRRPPIATRTDTLFPYTTLFRSTPDQVRGDEGGGKDRRMLFDLSGKVALVTGANTGIGQGIALALAEAGADIAAAGRSPATETVEKARALGRKAENFGADLSNVAAVQPLVDAVLGQFGRIDILVNNAGIIRRADAVDFTEADWDAVMDTNLKTLFFLCQAVGDRKSTRLNSSH